MDFDISQFLLDFSSEHNTFEKIEKLVSYTTKFVKPNLQQSLYLEFMRKAISQVPSIFESILKLVNEIGNKEEFVDDVEKILQASGRCLETLLLCFSSDRTSEEMLTLYVVSLNTLHLAYQHCKDSELIYEHQLENVADKLALFFNQIQDLEMAVLVDLDKLLVLNPDSMVQNIATMLGKLGQLLSVIDAMVSFKYWKLYIKIIVKHKEILKQNFMVDSDLIFLTSEILNFFENCRLIADQDVSEEEEVSLKVCSLQMNVIIRILEQNYDCINDSIPHLVYFIVNIYDLLIFCYSKKLAERTILFNIQSVLSKVPKQLTSLLKQNQSFLEHVFRNKVMNENDWSLASCMVKLACLPNFEVSTEDFNFIEFLQMFFGTLQSYKPAEHVKLVSIMIPESALGKLLIPIPQEAGFTSIYNYACSEISTCWKSYPNSTLEDGVASLLQILSTSSDVVSLLLCDTWIYRLRYTSIDFLYSYCLKISEAYCRSSPNMKVDNFLKRILKFLPFEKKGKILNEIDSLRSLTSRKYPSSHRFQIPQLLSLTDDKKDFNELFQSVVLELQKESSSSSESFSCKACCCLILSSYFVEVLPSYEICKLIEFAERMFKLEVYEIQIAVLTFLKSCSKKCIPENDPYGKDRWKALASLFLEGLLSSNYIVRCEAYRAFSNLANESPRSKIIQQTLMLAPHLMPSVTSNFNLVPVCGLLSEEIRLKLFCERISLRRKTNPATPEYNAYFELLTLKDQ